MTDYEVWWYEARQYDNNVAGLFTAIIDKFTRTKQQASDWLNSCTSEEERLRYIKEFFERKDVQLELPK